MNGSRHRIRHCYESMSRTPIRDRLFRQPLIRHSRHPFANPAPHSSFRRRPEYRGEGWHQPHPNTSNDQVLFSYLSVPAPAGMSDCYENGRSSAHAEGATPSPSMSDCHGNGRPAPTRNGRLPLPRWERVGVRVSPVALGPVPSRHGRRQRHPNTFANQCAPTLIPPIQSCPRCG